MGSPLIPSVPPWSNGFPCSICEGILFPNSSWPAFVLCRLSGVPDYGHGFPPTPNGLTAILPQDPSNHCWYSGSLLVDGVPLYFQWYVNTCFIYVFWPETIPTDIFFYAGSHCENIFYKDLPNYPTLIGTAFFSLPTDPAILSLAYGDMLIPDPLARYTTLQNSDGSITYKVASKNIPANCLIKVAP